MSQASERASLAVIGAGAWGTVLAALLSRNGHDVTLWARRPELAAAIERTHANPTYAPGLHLGPNVIPTADLDAAVDGTEAVFFAVPSKGLRETLARISVPIHAFVSCAKGLERGTVKRFSEVIAERWPEARAAALSGPNLATEIARGLPAAATFASHDDALALDGQRWLQQSRFRVYRSDDVIGVEVGGAMKNVVALAAGMVDGLGLGDNAKAGIITRGLAEIARVGVHLGGDLRTFYGLSGVGDLVATCASTASRNHTAGARIATGSTLAELESEGWNAEGIPTVRAVVSYADAHGLDLPIAREVHDVIYSGKEPLAALDALMTRELRPE